MSDLQAEGQNQARGLQGDGNPSRRGNLVTTGPSLRKSPADSMNTGTSEKAVEFTVLLHPAASLLRVENIDGLAPTASYEIKA
jgi:hypothetical protein